MQAGLTGFARALTGRNVTVELAVGIPRTDGKRIYYHPPIALGDNHTHVRSLCNKRDPETLVLKCKACDVHEEIMVDIYHEIGHIAGGSFEKPSQEDIDVMIKASIDERGSKYSKLVQDALKQRQTQAGYGYISVSSLLSEYMPILVNVLEDCRVDVAMHRARKGTKIMFDSQTQKLFRDGKEADDGTILHWIDRPVNHQAVIGILLIACKYKYDGWLLPEIEEMLKDEELNRIVRRIDSATRAKDAYRLAFPVLDRLRELGYCKLPEDPIQDEPEDEPEESGEPGESGESSQEESDESGSLDESGDPGPASEDGSGSSGSPESDPGEESASEEGDDSTDGSPGDGSESSDDSSDSSDGSGSGESDPDGDAGSSDGSGTESGRNDSSNEEQEQVDGTDSDSVSPGSVDGEGSPSVEGRGAGGTADESPQSGSSQRAPEGSDPGEDSEEGRADSLHQGDEDGAPCGSPDQAGSGGGAGDGNELVLEGSSDEAVPGRHDESGEPDGEGDRGSGNGQEDSGRSEQASEQASELDPVESGEDRGMGGVQTNAADGGRAADLNAEIKVFAHHDLDFSNITPEDHGSSAAEEAAMEVAIMQSLYFETASQNVAGVRIHKFGQPILDSNGDILSEGWPVPGMSQATLVRKGFSCDMSVDEAVIGPMLLQMRAVFAENRRAEMLRNQRSGRVRTKSLGRRFAIQDDRLFQKKRIPGKRSYGAILGIDISGSTTGTNVILAKRAAKYQAELFFRTGVEFAIYAHTAWRTTQKSTLGDSSLWLDMYEIKRFDELWNEDTKSRLDSIGPDALNLDGHGLEYYRKVIEKTSYTDLLIEYFTDGEMPAANHDEELEILQREIKVCAQKKIHLVGVGIHTDSPIRHGLDTVQIDSENDLKKVITHIGQLFMR